MKCNGILSNQLNWSFGKIFLWQGVLAMPSYVMYSSLAKVSRKISLPFHTLQRFKTVLERVFFHLNSCMDEVTDTTKVFVRLISLSADEIPGAKLATALRQSLSHVISLLCLDNDLERPFSCGRYNLGLATDSVNRGAN